MTEIAYYYYTPETLLLLLDLSCGLSSTVSYFARASALRNDFRKSEGVRSDSELNDAPLLCLDLCPLLPEGDDLRAASRSSSSSGNTSCAQNVHNLTPLYSLEAVVRESFSFRSACLSPKLAFFESTPLYEHIPVRFSTLNHSSHSAHVFFCELTVNVGRIFSIHGPGSTTSMAGVPNRDKRRLVNEKNYYARVFLK